MLVIINIIKPFKYQGSHVKWDNIVSLHKVNK